MTKETMLHLAKSGRYKENAAQTRLPRPKWCATMTVAVGYESATIQGWGQTEEEARSALRAYIQSGADTDAGWFCPSLVLDRSAAA